MLNKSFKHLSVALAANLDVNSKKFLYFGGTAYLGIPQHSDFQKLYIEGIQRFGLNNGTSRNNNIQLGIYNDAEQFAAEKYGAAAALITSSGYLAAQLSVRELSKLGELRYAPDCHPALWLNEKPETSGTFNLWAKNLVAEINESKISHWVIISNSMNNLYPELYDFSPFEKISSKKEVVLLVDDSHGIGINYSGQGCFRSLPTAKNINLVVVASMAKALGLDAGLILASAQIIDKLKQTATFIGASPPAAAGLYAFMNADSIYQSALQKLISLTHQLAIALKNESYWSFIPDFPVFLSQQKDLEERLLQKEILISSFPYPDKDGDLINRVILSSWHQQRDVQQLINVILK